MASREDVKSLTQLQKERPYRQAAATYEQALEQHPDDLKSLLGLGYARLGLRQYDETVHLMGTALVITPNSAEAHYLMGWAYKGLRADRLAERYFRTAVGLEPGTGKYHASLGSCLYRRQPEEALTYMESAYLLDPQSLGPHPTRALWVGRIFCGFGPNSWLVSYSWLALLAVLAQFQETVPPWLARVIPIHPEKGLGALILLPVASAPFLATIVVQFRRRRWRRALWALILSIVWGLVMWRLLFG